MEGRKGTIDRLFCFVSTYIFFVTVHKPAGITDRTSLVFTVYPSLMAQALVVEKFTHCDRANLTTVHPDPHSQQTQSSISRATLCSGPFQRRGREEFGGG